MSDITRIDQAINFDIDQARGTVDDNITVMETRASELRDLADHAIGMAENISDSKEGYTRVVNLLEELQEAIEHVDGEAEGAMSDAEDIDTNY
jgi:hypothetical protein